MHGKGCRDASSASIFMLFFREGAPFRSQLLYSFIDNKTTITAKHLSARIISYHRTPAATRATITKHRNIFYHNFTKSWAILPAYINILFYYKKFVLDRTDKNIIIILASDAFAVLVWHIFCSLTSEHYKHEFFGSHVSASSHHAITQVLYTYMENWQWLLFHTSVSLLNLMGDNIFCHNCSERIWLGLDDKNFMHLR